MKIICIDSSTQFFVKADTTLLRNNEPFFAPDFGTGVVRTTGISAKITRIVKCIEPRFAHRAWDEYMPSTEHTVNGVDAQKGRNFDRSFEVSPEICPKGNLSLEKQTEIDEAISYVSQYVSLRIGDYVFIPEI